MVRADSVCGRRVLRVKPQEIGYWGVECCSSCKNIVIARNSWMEVYA